MAEQGAKVRMGSPSSFGWVPFREKHTDATFAWERPDGVLVHAPKFDKICVVRIGNEPPYLKIMRKA